MIKRSKYELHIYWDDGVTIECRYFNTKKKDAMEYVKNNGITNYQLIKRYGNL